MSSIKHPICSVYIFRRIGVLDAEMAVQFDLVWIAHATPHSISSVYM